MSIFVGGFTGTAFAGMSGFAAGYGEYLKDYKVVNAMKSIYNLPNNIIGSVAQAVRLDILLNKLGYEAITFGDIVIGPFTKHEEWHTHQYDILGPLFIPSYLLSSALSAVTGGGFYCGNIFEVEAFLRGGVCR